MATTGRPRGRHGAREGVDARRGYGRIATRTGAHLAVATVVAVAPLIAPASAYAQKWSIDAGISSELSWTSNAELGQLGGRDDTILDIRPNIRLRGEGGRLKFSGTAALSAITYANHTQPSRLEPEADLRAELEAIERLLFLEAGLRALQTSANPFGARPETGATSENSITTSQARFAPRIEGAAGDRLRYRLSSDNSWTHESGSTAATTGVPDSAGYFGRHAVRIEQDPQPLGWRIEGERSETRYRDASQEPLVLDTARVTLNYGIGSEWTLGVHAGRERTSFVTEDGRRDLYGVDVRWRPSPRTLFSVLQEHRFFGSAWRAAFEHRTPQFALSMVSARALDTTPQSVFDLPATDNVAALIDAAFTTRYPDPIERARIVQDFIARQGLPPSTLQPISLRAQRLSLVTLHSATVTLIGTRNSVSLTGYKTRTEDAIDTGPFALGTAATNNDQYGAAIALSHRLSPTMSLIASADWSRIRALEAVGGERSTQRTARVRLNVETGRKTTAYAGARYRDLDSNTVESGREGAIFVGLDHRF